MEYVTKSEVEVSNHDLMERALTGVRKLVKKDPLLFWTAVSRGTIVTERTTDNNGNYNSGYYAPIFLDVISKEECVGIHAIFAQTNNYSGRFMIKDDPSSYYVQIGPADSSTNEKASIVHALVLCAFIANEFEKTGSLRKLKLKADVQTGEYSGWKGQILIYNFALSKVDDYQRLAVDTEVLKNGVQHLFGSVEGDMARYTYNTELFPKTTGKKTYEELQKLEFEYGDLSATNLWTTYMGQELFRKICNNIHKSYVFCDSGRDYRSGRPRNWVIHQALDFILNIPGIAQKIAEQALKLRSPSHVEYLMFAEYRYFDTCRGVVNADDLLDYYDDNCRESGKAARTIAALVFLLDDPDVFGPSFFHFNLGGTNAQTEAHSLFEANVNRYKAQERHLKEKKEKAEKTLRDYAEGMRKTFMEDLPGFYDLIGFNDGTDTPEISPGYVFAKD